MASLDWDDLRHPMAIATAGSLAGAARALSVNHTTVLRRLDALEAHLGSRLFDLHRTGYQPTEAGLEVLEQARHMGNLRSPYGCSLIRICARKRACATSCNALVMH